MRNRLLSGITVLALAAGMALGQAAPSRPPAFDAATIKPSAPLDMAKMAADIRAGQMPKMGPHVQGLLAEYTYMSLKDLIGLAYGVKAYQVTGPDWLASARFDIVARLPEGASKDDAPAMLRTLLQDRFKLAAHTTTGEHPVLALVPAKGGPKMKEATAPPPLDESAPLKPGEMKMDTPDGPARLQVSSDGVTTVNLGARGVITQKVDMATGTVRMDSSSITMSGFADMLTRVLQMGGGSNRQVVDMTGLKGNYQVSLDLSLSDLLAMARSRGLDIPGGAGGPGGFGGSAASGSALAASTPNGGATIYESVAALGLKLEARNAPVEQLLVDTVQKTPSEN
jgi:uncharacterized protein (TIGR03435 family)